MDDITKYTIAPLQFCGFQPVFVSSAVSTGLEHWILVQEQRLGIYSSTKMQFATDQCFKHEVRRLVWTMLKSIKFHLMNDINNRDAQCFIFVDTVMGLKHSWLQATPLYCC